MLVNPYWFNSFVPGVWTSACVPSYAYLDESDRLFVGFVASNTEVAIVNRPKTTGKWFWAYEIASFSNFTFRYAGGFVKTANINTSPRTFSSGPNVNEVCYGFFLTSKKWVFGVQSSYGSMGASGGIFGMSYDADTGDIHGYDWNGSAWIDKGLLTTVTANTSMCPLWMAPATPGRPVSARLRSDLAPPSGFSLWA